MGRTPQTDAGGEGWIFFLVGEHDQAERWDGERQA